MSDGQDRPSLKPGRSPDYWLIKDVEGLPKGSFVRPIGLRYLAKDILARLGVSPDMNEDKYIVCYTAKGLVVIPTDAVRER